MGELSGEVYLYKKRKWAKYTVRDTANFSGETYYMLKRWAHTSYVEDFKQFLIAMCTGTLNSCIDEFVRKAVDLGLDRFEVRSGTQAYEVKIVEE